MDRETYSSIVRYLKLDTQHADYQNALTLLNAEFQKKFPGNVMSVTPCNGFSWIKTVGGYSGPAMVDGCSYSDRQRVIDQCAGT